MGQLHHGFQHRPGHGLAAFIPAYLHGISPESQADPQLIFQLFGPDILGTEHAALIFYVFELKLLLHRLSFVFNSLLVV